MTPVINDDSEALMLDRILPVYVDSRGNLSKFWKISEAAKGSPPKAGSGAPARIGEAESTLPARRSGERHEAKPLSIGLLLLLLGLKHGAIETAHEVGRSRVDKLETATGAVYPIQFNPSL